MDFKMLIMPVCFFIFRKIDFTDAYILNTSRTGFISGNYVVCLMLNIWVISMC